MIQDDLIVAGRTLEEHDEAMKTVCEAIRKHGLTLNPAKCSIAKDDISWWGMRINKDGITPDPQKVEAVKTMTPPASKEEVNSLVCMLQSDGYGRDFIPGLAERTKCIRKLLKKDAQFVWSKECQQEFEAIKEAFSENILMAHFDPKMETAIEVDASQNGLSAILIQGPAENQKVVAVASRSTSETESKYPQIDLEALAVDFGLRRFSFYLEGAAQFTVYTDHQPLQSIFRNTRSGSIRTQRIRLRHQNLDYKVVWKKGKTMRSDYMSRHAIPWPRVPKDQQEEARELDKLIWFVQYDPYIEAITVERLIQETAKDETLQALGKSIRKGYIRKSDTKLKSYRDLIQELTITSEGLIMKGDRIILSEKLIQRALKKKHTKEDIQVSQT